MTDKILFPKLGLEFTVKADAFSIFGFAVQWYGIIIAFGLLLAITYCFRRTNEFGVDGDRAFDAVFMGVIGGIIGARLYFVMMSWDLFKDDLYAIFDIKGGGLAIYGGIIGAVLFGGITCKIRKQKFLPLLDLAGMGFLIGQSVGRWGNFVNREAYGRNTSLPWGMTSNKISGELYIKANEIYADTGVLVDPTLPVHPCFLYESLWCALGFLLLHLYAKHRKFDGEVFLMYIGWYGLGRMFIEGLRTDSLMVGSLRVSQVLAGLCFLAAVTIIAFMRRKVKVDGYTFFKDTEEFAALIRETKEKEQLRQEKAKAKKNSLKKP
ncbi:MAG: prolipoprotein diacylglyceryl transferase [Oscillospiraceae bacterium]|nr:prolipoprotein diacylglyceryl transferase [Oscillospiraceae bacterium]